MAIAVLALGCSAGDRVPDPPITKSPVIDAAPGPIDVAWAASADSSRDGYEDLASGELREETTRMQLAERTGGAWLIWFTDLPEQEEGVYYTVISEVSFRS